MSTRCPMKAGRRSSRSTSITAIRSELADQVFLFKRTVRQAALKHDMYATFMAKPHENEPGSSMHIHQSVMDAKTGKNIFAGPRRQASPSSSSITSAACSATSPRRCRCRAQRELLSPAGPESDAPTNVHWAIDNRTVSLRVPASDPVNCASRTASPAPMPIPISPSPRRSPAAISA